MRPQFHLPLTTYPETSSFKIIENAIQFSLHQDADLVAASRSRVAMAFRPRMTCR